METTFTDEAKDISVQVSAGNPGAMVVIGKLMWFSKWYEMMRWCLRWQATGSTLWELYKDIFDKDEYELGKWIQRQMVDEDSPVADLGTVRVINKKTKYKVTLTALPANLAEMKERRERTKNYKQPKVKFE